MELQGAELRRGIPLTLLQSTHTGRVQAGIPQTSYCSVRVNCTPWLSEFYEENAMTELYIALGLVPGLSVSAQLPLWADIARQNHRKITPMTYQIL
eukprot:1161471-Pelagomonas_calceolata.AAC.1